MVLEKIHEVDYPPERDRKDATIRDERLLALGMSEFLELEKMLQEDQAKYRELNETLAECGKNTNEDTQSQQNQINILRGALDTLSKRIRDLQMLIAYNRPIVEEKKALLLRKITRKKAKMN